MKTSILTSFATALALIGCSTVNLKKIDESFNIENLKNKRLVCIDSSTTENGKLISPLNAGIGSSAVPLLPDFDGMYARNIFEETYPDPTVYTTPLLKSVCSIITNKLNLNIPENQKSYSSDSAYDYSLVLKNIKFYERVKLKSSYSIRDLKSTNELAIISITSEDKFSLGGEGRFKQSFTELAKQTPINFEKNFSSLYNQPTSNR